MNCDVSVIMPAYNSSDTLERALDSIYGQSLPPREIIVVDDGSDDWEKSRRIAASYPEAIALRFIHTHKNQGVSSARNMGISLAQCRYLAFLDSDDAWYRNKLAIQYGLMTTGNLDFSMHQYRDDMNCLRCDDEDVDSHDRSLCLSSLTSWTPLLRNDNTSCVMVLKQKMVSYDTSLRRGEDFMLYMELLSRRGCRAAYIKRVLAGAFKRTLGASGLSGDVKAMHCGRMDALKKLLDRNKIGLAQYSFGIGTETLKYPLRVLRISLRRAAASREGSR